MNPYLILTAAAVWLASVVGVGYWQRHDGEAAVTAKYEAQEAKRANATAQAIAKAEDTARASEQRHSAELAQIGENHAQEMHDAEELRKRDVDAARNHAIRLRDPGGCQHPDEAGQVPAPSGGSDVAKGSELSDTTSAFLLGLADDADRNTVQLSACQAVIRSYIQE